MRLRSTQPQRKVARGAVLVEFIVALAPLLVTFFSLVQLGKMMTAQLAFKHAATVASRAAAVIMNEPQNPNASGKKEEVEQAAILALGEFSMAFSAIDATVTLGAGPNDPVTVELSGTYECTVPLGKTIVCGLSASHDFKPVRSALPLYGARYKVDKQ
jgi:Flp pilus assembly protein TadG